MTVHISLLWDFKKKHFILTSKYKEYDFVFFHK